MVLPSSENFIKEHPVAAVGILAAPAIAATAPATAKGAYIYAATNPEKVTLASQFIWGLGTDEDVPGSGIDDLGRGTRHGIGVLTREAMAQVRGGTAKTLNGTAKIREFANRIYEINRKTDGGGELWNGTPLGAISSALYHSTPSEQGAAIFRSIAHGHMFGIGKRRTAVEVFQVFAQNEGLRTVSQKEMLNIATQVATSEITDISQIANMLIKN